MHITSSLLILFKNFMFVVQQQLWRVPPIRLLITVTYQNAPLEQKESSFTSFELVAIVVGQERHLSAM